MPAIQLERLKHQAEQLTERFEQPEHFVRHLEDLLEQYSDHTYRPGQAGDPPPLIPWRRVPLPVLRMIAQTLEGQVAHDGASALALCDALWAQAVMEFRWLAALILGRVEAQHSPEILRRAAVWLNENDEARLLEVILTDGLGRMRAQRAEQVLLQAQAWLSEGGSGAKRLRAQRAAVRLLQMLVSGDEFENLPAVYHSLARPLSTATAELGLEYSGLLNALAERSPAETAHFFEQVLAGTHGGYTEILIRQALDELPEGYARRVRAVMKAR